MEENNNKDIQTENTNNVPNTQNLDNKDVNIFDIPSTDQKQTNSVPAFPETSINNVNITGNIFDTPSHEPQTYDNNIAKEQKTNLTFQAQNSQVSEQNTLSNSTVEQVPNYETFKPQETASNEIRNESNEKTLEPEKKEQTEEVEIFDLNEENNNVNEKNISNEERPNKRKTLLDLGKENKIILLILIGIVIFAFMLPTITSWFSRNSIFTYTDKMEDIKNTDTINGMLEINSEKGSITARNIKFYNFVKKTNNEITVVYLPETGINNVKDKNIFIELYNKSKNLIYRTQFLSEKKLERKVQGTYKINVNETLYKEASYGKIVVIDDKEFSKENETLACTLINKENDIEIENKITYSFSSQGLTKYVVIKKITNPVETDNDNLTSPFEKEQEMINKTNVADLTYDFDKIQYTIDLLNFNSNNSNYETLYTKGSLKRQITLSEQAKGWSCK